MNSLDDRIRKYIESMNLRNNPRITLKKIGINNGIHCLGNLC